MIAQDLPVGARPAEKPVPSDVDAEEAVLGSLLIDPEAIVKVSTVVEPGDFYREKNGWIYAACLSLHDRNEAINQITVAHDLARQDRLEPAGGVAYLSQLVASALISLLIILEKIVSPIIYSSFSISYFFILL